MMSEGGHGGERWGGVAGGPGHQPHRPVAVARHVKSVVLLIYGKGTGPALFV